MRKSVMIIFIVGLIMLVGGIVLAIAAPATVTWKPKSEVLASEKALTVSAGWASKSESLIDKVITVDFYETYDYWFGYKPLIYGEAKGFVISGTATEQSSPQRWFNFYVFDNVNFDLWKAGASYTAYYEVKGVTSINFEFSITTKDAVPDTFYFVVEEYALGVKPVVRVTATISWVEKASIYDCSKYFTSSPILIIEESKDFVLKGNVTEVGNHIFNFYIMDSDNYLNWFGGKAYVAYFEKKNVTSTSFSIPLTKDQATSAIYFVAENPLVDINETVKVSATLEWQEKATIAATIGGWILGGIIAILGFIVIIIAGVLALILKPKTS
ncbi:MAG: hypothetical protein QXP36_08295 [Conexivisphaerales archaeon]